MSDRIRPSKRLKSQFSSLNTMKNGLFAHMPSHVMLTTVTKKLRIHDVLDLALVSREWRDLRSPTSSKCKPAAALRAMPTLTVLCAFCDSNQDDLWKHFFEHVNFWRFWPAEDMDNRAITGNKVPSPQGRNGSIVCWKAAYRDRHLSIGSATPFLALRSVVSTLKFFRLH
jgi:hypothetical protein